ncbi:hypothetical protein, partial [Aeromonas veronii]
MNKNNAVIEMGDDAVRNQGAIVAKLPREHLKSLFYLFAGKPDSREGANKRGNSPRLTQSFHFFMFEPI